MKLTRRQQKLINEMVRDEAERVIKGRRLFQESPVTACTVDDETVVEAVKDAVYENMRTWSHDKLDEVVDRLNPTIMKAIAHVAPVGGLEMGDILDEGSDDMQALQQELAERMTAAGEEYAVKVARLAARRLAVDSENYYPDMMD